MHTLLVRMTLGLVTAVTLGSPEKQARTAEFFIVAKGKPRTSPVN